MKTTEIELAGRCIDYCKRRLYALENLKEKRNADPTEFWSERMDSELQQLQRLFKRDN